MIAAFAGASLAFGAGSAILNGIAGAEWERRILLIEFRTATVEGWKIEAAALVLHTASGPAPKRVRISTVPVEWSESNAGAGARSAFRKPAIWGSYEAEPLPNGWVRVKLQPALVEAMAAGKSRGLAIATDKARFDGLAPVATQPYLMATGGRRE